VGKRILIELDDKEHEELLAKKGSMTWKEFLRTREGLITAKNAIEQIEKKSELHKMLEAIGVSDKKEKEIHGLGFVNNGDLKKALIDVMKKYDGQIDRMFDMLAQAKVAVDACNSRLHRLEDKGGLKCTVSESNKFDKFS